MLYSIYGLHLDAFPPIPGLIPSDEHCSPDVVVRLQTIDEPSAGREGTELLWYQSEWRDDRTGEPGLSIYQSIVDGAFRFHYTEGVEFIISAAGDHVLGRCLPDSSLADMATYLTGPVLGFLLRMRGVISLHASAIEIGGKAVAFVGDAGTGKSTTAAMFARMGYKVVTEDVAALSTENGGLAIRSGCAEVALCPDAVTLLYGSSDALPRFSAGWEKRRLDLAAAGAFAGRSVPLGAVYMLASRGGAPDAPCVESMTTGEAMVELLANIYGNRLFHRELRLRELDTVHRVAGAVPVKVATAGADGSTLERFCEVILDDVS